MVLFLVRGTLKCSEYLDRTKETLTREPDNLIYSVFYYMDELRSDLSSLDPCLSHEGNGLENFSS